MRRRFVLPALILGAVLFAAAGRAGEAGAAAEPALVPAAIVAPAGGALPERLAAREIRRFVYLRTGKLLPIVATLAAAGEAGGGADAAIVVGCRGEAALAALPLPADVRQAVAELRPQQYLLKTTAAAGRPLVLVAGGDAVGTLYAAYRLAGRLGVRFYLEGDVVPERRMALALPRLDERGRPLFEQRGIQPFHDFPEGPDWWDADGYKAVLAQLPKLRMNFFGLHTYPEGGVGPEPLAWIGLAGEAGAAGQVSASYPTRHFTTANGTWGYAAKATGRYGFGAGQLFERDDYGADYMRGMTPWPHDPAACNELFGRMGATLNEAFTFARPLGVRTCLGTETPLMVPKAVKERLKAAGKDPADPRTIEDLYAGMFQRIMQTHPLDYYWFWTPEGWTWSGVKQQQIDATLADLRAAVAAAGRVKAPFALATCGWVLGPPQNRALFDEVLPKSMPVSCINRMVGHDPVEPGFAAVMGRPKWAIPWMEDDPDLTAPQLWAGRMRRDAADALAYGCTGLMGIHWRTRTLGPNVAALADAAWDQHGWNPRADGKPLPPEPRPPEGPDGGKFAGTRAKIAGAADPTVYQSVRYDVEAYHLDVPNGSYTVTLRFVEPAYKEPGKRVFGVKLQGRPVIDQLDLFAKVGANRALDYTFKDVAVADGRMTIDFVRIVEHPCIAAIEIAGSVTRKINCGGPAYRDFQADWPPSISRREMNFLPIADFYADWALAQFGPEAARELAALFTRIDGHLPRPADWVKGPGGLKPDPRPWAEVAKQYAFVDDMAALQGRIQGAGNRERFDYWLETFRYLRAMGQVDCQWAACNRALAEAKAAAARKDVAAQRRIAREMALPRRRELIARVAEAHQHLLATLTTTGELGTVTNWQQHIWPTLIEGSGRELAGLLGEELPADAQPGADYVGPPRLVVPVVRTSLMAGEPLRLKVIVAGAKPDAASLYWRPLGGAAFTAVPLEHVARAVYRVTLPAAAASTDFEWYIEARLPDVKLVYPATAPQLNQSVVVAK